MTTRQRKSPRERAEERLGIEQRRVAKLDKAIGKAEADLAALKTERTAAAERLEYAERDPALNDQPLTGSAGDDTPEE